MTIFSKIITGEIPSYKCAENEAFYAFLDINPVAVGHTLVVPKLEVDYIFDMSDADLAAFEKRRQEFAGLPRTVVFGIDASGSVRRDLTERGLATPGDLPVLIVADTFNRVVSATQGYAVGLGTRLASLLGRLK